MASSSGLQRSKSPIPTILLAGLVAGTLDILAAITVYDLIMHRLTAIHLLQGIASFAFGKKAIDGGTSMAIYGLGFHFIIAFSFTIFYFIIFPYISFLRKQKILSGLLYGIFVWMVMNLAVLPLLGGKIPTKWDGILRGACILMVCIGLPISLIIGSYYEKQKLKI
jgi:hypothetical protein